MSALPKLLQTPPWAHAEYENQNDGILSLYESLEVGDVIRVTCLKSPLQVVDVHEDATVVRMVTDFKPKEYTVEPGDGRKYQLYLHRDKSKEGIGEMAVIYRNDASTSAYSVDEIDVLVEDADRLKISWESTHETIKPLYERTSNPLTEPRTLEQAEERGVVESLFSDPELLEVKQQMAKVRFEGGSVEDMDKLTTEVEFETEEAVIESLFTHNRREIPYGTVLFREPDRGKRYVVPIDKIEDIERV